MAMRSISHEASCGKRAAGSIARRRRGARAIAASIEALETRVLLSTINWIGGTGDWSVAGNWSGGVVPGISDDVTIPAGANVTISTNVQAGTLATAAGSTLTLSAAAQLNEGGGMIGGFFQWDGTLAGGASLLTLAGNTVITGTAAGAFITNTGTVTFNAGTLNGSAEFNNSGTVTITGGLALVSSNFTNSSGALLVNAGGGATPQGFVGFSGGEFVNQGILDQDSGTLAFGSSVNFENVGGIVNVNSGSVLIAGNASLQNGQLNVATATTLSFNNGDTTNPYGFNIHIAGTLTGSGGGAIDLVSGNFSAVTADSGIQAPVVLNFPSGMLQIGNVAFNQASSATITNSGYLTFSGSAGHGLISSITNQGTITVSGTSNLPLQTLINDTSGTLDIESTIAVTSGNLINNGVLNQDAGTLTVASGVDFENVGSIININSGAIVIATRAELQNVQLNVATGSSISFNNGDTTNPYSTNVHIAGTITGTGGGTVDLVSGNFSALTAVDSTQVPAVLNFPSGMLQIGNVAFDLASSAAIINSAYLTFTGSTGHGPISGIVNQGTITVSGTSNLPLQTLINDTSGTLDIESTIALTSGNLINNGVLNQDAGTLTVASGVDFENVGSTININSGAIVIATRAELQDVQLNVATGSSISFNNGDTTNPYSTNVHIAGTITGTGGGAVDLVSGNFSALAAVDSTQVPAVLNFPSGMLRAGNVAFNLASSATITNIGYLEFAGSAGHGTTNMVNEGTISLSGASNLPAQTFLNDTNAVFDLESTAGFTYAGGQGFVNKGQLNKLGAGTTVIQVASQAFFNDGGAIDVEAGSLSFQGGNFAYIAGPLHIAAGAKLDFNTTNGVYIQGTLTSTGAGSVTLSSGWFAGPDANFNETSDAPAELDFAPNTLFVTGGFIDDASGGGSILNNAGYLYYQNNTPDAVFNFGQTLNSGHMFIGGNTIVMGKGDTITNAPGGIIDFTAPTVIAPSINIGFLNQGLAIFNAPGGTMNLATPFTFDANLGGPGFENQGTLEVASGTLVYPSISFGNPSIVAAGATYQVDAGATLTTEVPVSVTTNNGTVILGGAGASFPAINSLTTNNGTLAVDSGATFTTAHDFTNTGTLTVGGSVTIGGSFTQSQGSGAAPTLDFQVAAAAGSPGAPHLSVALGTTLAGNLTAEYANGFASVPNTLYNVATFTGSAVGSFASTVGVGPAFTANVSDNGIALTSTLFGSTDLAVTSMTAPSSASPGQAATITWDVTNNSTDTPTSKSWVDSVYLSANDTVDASDILLGQVTETGALAPGDSYTGTLTTLFPAAKGMNHIIVVVDSGRALADFDRSNNVDSSVVTSTIPTLTLGGNANGTLSAGQSVVYQLTLPGGSDVNVSAQLGGLLVSDLEISDGAIPTPATAQFVAPINSVSPNISTTIAHPQPGVYYITLRGQSTISGAQPFTLSATTVAPGATGVSPSVLGTGKVSVTVTGSGFASNALVELINGSGQPVTAILSTTVRDSDTILVNMDLTNVATGQYTLRVISDGLTTNLPNAITVQPITATTTSTSTSTSSNGGISYQLVVQSVIRPNVASLAYVEYTNTSNVDVPAEWLNLSEPNLSFELVGGSNPDIAGDNTYSDYGIDLMAINQDGDAGVLPPGYSAKLLVSIKPLINDIAHYQFNPVLVEMGTSTSTYDLSQLVGPLPTNLSQTTADILAAEVNGLSALPTLQFKTSAPLAKAQTSVNAYPVTPDLTVTDAALNNKMDAIATVLSGAGVYEADFGRLMAYAESAADDFGAIDAANQGGAFGFGSPDPYLYEIVEDDVGDAAFVTPAGTELFETDANGNYLPAASDSTSTLTQNSGGTTWTLDDDDGTVYQFSQSFNLGGVAQVTSITTPSGLTTTFNYGPSSPNATNPPLLSIDLPGNLTTTLAYDSAGLVTSVTDPTGAVTTFGYTTDASGTPLMTSIITPAGTTTFTYTTSPIQQRIINYNTLSGIEGTPAFLTSPAAAYLPTSITLPDGSGEKFTYDSFGREIKSTLLDGSDPVTFSYDNTGLVVTTTYANGSSSQDVLGAGGESLKETDGVGDSTFYQYTPDGLLASIIAPLGASVTATYTDGNQTGGTSASGSSGSATYNALNEPTTLTDGNGNVVGITYNAGGQLTKITEPDQSTQQYAYNPLGEISQITQRSGLVLNIAYDAHGNVTQNIYSDGATYSYTYDSLGDLLTATGPTGTITYTYNAAGEVTSFTDAAGRVQTYTYDSHGLLSTVADTSGVVSRYTYDSDARLSQITDGAGNLVVAYTYDSVGRISMETFGNGNKTVYAYDADGRETSISNLNASNMVITSTTYAYNAQDLPVTATDQSGNVTTYGYDLAGELISVILPGGRTITYTYDPDGNRISVTDSGTTTDYTSNVLDQYTAAGTTTFTYDANGNMASQTDPSGTTNYTYDETGQLTSSTGPNGNFTYTYDAVGELIAYTDNGVETTIERDGGGNVAATYDADGNLLDQYQYGYRLVSAAGDDGSLYYDADLAGNITGTTNASGTTVNTYSYLPFGEKLTSTGPADNLFTFSGGTGVLDLGDGNYQTDSRTYSPSLGRFIQPDPLGQTVSSNLYNYVENSPTTYADPGGYEPEQEGGAEKSNPTLGYEQGLPVIPGHVEATVSVQQTADHNIVISGGGVVGHFAPSAGEIGKVMYTEHPPTESGEEVTASRWAAGIGVEYGKDGKTYIATPSAYGQTVNYKYNFVVKDHLGQEEANAVETYYENAYKTDKKDVFSTSYDQARLETHYMHQYRTAQDYNALHLGKLIQGKTGQAALDILHHYHFYGIDLKYLYLILPGDPNDLSGPQGFGDAGYVQSGQTFPYTIEFQNEPDASAAAQTVIVTQQLDPNLDWSTFQLTNFSFGSYSVNIPAGQTSYSTRVDATATVGVYVDISASLDINTGLLTVTYTSIDPVTLTDVTQVPADVLLGFLPPDDATGQGAGSISYTIQPNASLATGTVINAQGSIVFDTNAAIATPMLTNTIDAAAPTSTVTTLPDTETSNSFAVNWSGQDDASGSGIASYSIYVSTDGGAFAPWLINTTATSSTYQGSPGHTYAFESTAVDNVGNAELLPAVAQATTSVPAIARTLTVSAGHTLKFTDAADQTVTVTLSGPGTGTLNFLTAMGNADPASIVLTGTTAQSKFTINNSGVLALSDIQIAGPLGSFSAAKANFSGTFDAAGTLGTLALDNIETGASAIDIEGSAVPVSITFGTAQDLSLTSAAGIKSLTAVQWTNGIANADSLTAPSIAKMQIKGNFDPTVTLTDLNLGAGSVAITGTLTGTWNVTGGATSISAGSIDAGWNASFGGAVGTIAVKGAMSGSLTALSLKSLSVGGAMTDSNLQLTAASPGSLAIKGAITGGSWTIHGGEKTISAASIGGGFTATFTGDVGALSVKGDLSGSLTARSIKTLKVGGNLTASTLQLTGSNAVLGKTLALGSLTVTGSLTNSQIRSAGNIGAVTVGGATGSDLFAGVNGNITNQLPAAADLAAVASIGTVTVKGTSVFANSFIAASALGTVKLANVTTDNAGVPFGLAAATLNAFTLTQPHAKPFQWTSKQSPSLLAGLPGDLHVELL